jgi:hypothetical protein
MVGSFDRAFSSRQLAPLEPVGENLSKKQHVFLLHSEIIKKY